MTIEWIIFDLGGVLIEVNFNRIYHAFENILQIPAGSLESQMKFDVAVWKHLYSRHCEPEDIRKLLGKWLPRPMTDAEIRQAVNAELGEEIHTTVEVLEKLSRTHRTACLSNTNSIHWNEMLQRCKFPQFLHEKLASQELGLCKPDAEIYERTLEVLKTTGNKCLFFDDRVENVEGARKVGINAELFTSHEQFIIDLNKHHVII